MIRLAFYDTKGLDFLSFFVNSSSEVLTALLILYLILTGVIILNGLLGIFGGIFINSSSKQGQRSHVLDEDDSLLHIEEMLMVYLP